MELAGSGYLYTLAVVATTFAGFAVITMIFHQVYGGHVTKLDSFVARTFTQVGFLATLGALLPPLVAQFELTPATVWRAASAGLAALLGLWSLSFPHRRHKAATTPIPPLVWSVVVVLDLTAILLLGNALLSLPAHAAGIYSVATTVILAGGASFFPHSLTFLFERRPDTDPPRRKAKSA